MGIDEELTPQQAAPPPVTLETHGELAPLLDAIADAQGEFDTPSKSKKGRIGNIDYDYAPLVELIRATKPALKKNKVSYNQPLTSSPVKDGWHRLTLMVAGHGGRIMAHMDFDPMLVDKEDGKADIKSYGKRTTYLRRYQFQAFFMLDGEADADTDAGSNGGPGGKRRCTSQRGQAQTLRTS
jgi:hypothetical protein